MKKLVPTRLDPLLLTVALAAVFVSSAAGQTVTWQALPFPVDSDWPGPFGHPAAINANSIVLQGQPARTVESFAAPFAIRCDVQLASRFTDDGGFTIHLLEPGQPTDTDPRAGLSVHLTYSNTGDFGSVDRLEIAQLGGASLWSDPTFHLAGGRTYHLMLQVSGAGALHLDIDGTSYPIDSSVVFPYAQAQIQLGGWQPNDTYFIDNIVVQPLPMLAASVAGTNIILSWPTSVVGFVLQSSTNFLSTSDWVNVSNGVIVVESNRTVTLGSSSPRQFFRLKL